jgi:predicted methyltransferase
MTVRKSVWILVMSLLLANGLQAAEGADNEAALRQAIDSRSTEEKARDTARHPYETMVFFQVEPGMTVAEALPGGGWYTNILANYLGSDGALYGSKYQERIWTMFPDATEEWIEKHKERTAQFPDLVDGLTDNGIETAGFTFNTVPPDLAGTVDRILLIRALHNLNRFESQAGTRSQALAAVRNMLKDDGLVGVVQHRAPASDAESGSDGSRGYLEEADVIISFENAGFELVSTSDINANPTDVPGSTDIVWRLPPSLATSKEDPELKAKMEAIGESDRMTLLFRKAP